MPYSQALRVAEKFAEELPKLQQMGVASELLDVMRTSNHSTWLQMTASHGGRTIMTGKGIRQGCRLAPYLFCCFHSVATQRMRDRMEEAGVLMKLPVAPVFYEEAEDQHGEVEISNLSFVDDLLAPLWCKDPVILLAMAATLSRIVVHTFQEIGLPVNFKPQKTEFLIALRGARAKDLYEGLRYDGDLCSENGPVLVYDREDVTKIKAIRVAKQYKYLGKIVTPTGSQLKENRARAGQAMAAVRDMKRVFETVGLSARLKVNALIVKVLSILLFGAHVLMKMTGPEYRVLNTCYMAAIRSAAGESWGRRQVITDSEVLRKVGLPTLEHQLYTRRVVFWPKIFRHRSPVIRACLSIDFKDYTWWGPQFQAMAAFANQCLELADSPAPSVDTIRQWRKIALDLGPKWTVLAKQFGRSGAKQGDEQSKCGDTCDRLVVVNDALGHGIDMTQLEKDTDRTLVSALEQAIAEALEEEFEVVSDEDRGRQEEPTIEVEG
eukprot:1202686-Amphidinium_carterae.1